MRDALKQLLTYLAVEEIPATADIVVGLGSDAADVGHRVADLFAQGLARRVLFAGGRGRLTGSLPGTEAAFLKTIAVTDGVCEDAIILEETSSNTLENIRFSWSRLVQEGIRATRIILVTQPVLQRRAWATARRWWPPMSLQNCPPQWRTSIQELDDRAMGELARLAIGEIDRLGHYSDKGDIEAQVPPQAVTQACKAIREAIELKGQA